ncbi:MAG TPA: serine/threonine-protein kinase [Candidatus Obscuribacterales bacterium]
MEHLESQDQAITIRKCPNCGLELAGENAICACDPNFLIVPAQDPMLGQTLGCYKIVEVIGRGGMGVIYKAHDQWMDRTIAIKMLHQHLVHDPQSLQRFNQEAKAAGNIEHPNVIQAYDFGVAPGTEQPFLVMEFLQGKSLSDEIEQQRNLEPERAVNIFIQASEALAAAHAKNVLHRDLKPSNIMLIETKDQPDFVKIVDFGIAKLLPGSGKEVQLTQTGEVFGSPLYMSPEQFVGRKVDTRSDIYSMGCVMYEALIGKPPIAGDHVLETMYKHMNERPRRFSEVRSDLKISPKLEAVVMRALEKEPENRYQSMSELHDDLLLTKTGFKDRRPLKVKLKAKMSQLRRFRKRYEDLASNALLAVLSMVIAGSIVGFAWMFLRTNQEANWRDLKRQAQEHYRKEELPQAEDLLKKAAGVAKDNFGDEDPRFIDTLKRLAWVLNAQQKYSEGRKLFEKVYRLSSEEVRKIKFAQSTLAANQMLSNIMQDTTTGPEAILRRSSETIEKYLGSNDPELIPLLEQLALVYQADGKFVEAETQYLRIFSIMRETEGDDSIGAAYAHKLLGGLYHEWALHERQANNRKEAEDKTKEAEENFGESIRIYRSIVGPDSAQVKDVEDLLAGKKEPENIWKPKSTTPDNTIPQF